MFSSLIKKRKEKFFFHFHLGNVSVNNFHFLLGTFDKSRLPSHSVIARCLALDWKIFLWFSFFYLFTQRRRTLSKSNWRHYCLLSMKKIKGGRRVKMLRGFEAQLQDWENFLVKIMKNFHKNLITNDFNLSLINDNFIISFSCPEGFSGKICEDKTPNITASTYNKQQECPQYLGSFYC